MIVILQPLVNTLPLLAAPVPPGQARLHWLLGSTMTGMQVIPGKGGGAVELCSQLLVRVVGHVERFAPSLADHVRSIWLVQSRGDGERPRWEGDGISPCGVTLTGRLGGDQGSSFVLPGRASRIKQHEIVWL